MWGAPCQADGHCELVVQFYVRLLAMVRLQDQSEPIEQGTAAVRKIVGAWAGAVWFS